MTKANRIFYHDWIVANAWAEAIGLSGTFIIGYLAAPMLETRASVATILISSLAAVILGTLLEGALVGFAQENVLRDRFSRDIPRYAWTRATAMGAGLAWILGMIPSTIFSLLERETGSIPAKERSAIVQYGLAVILGLVLGPILGFAQARVLRRLTGNSNKWLLANAVA